MSELLFTGGTVVTAEGSYRADVLVEDRSWLYLVRLAAFLLIIAAIVRKTLEELEERGLGLRRGGAP